MSLFTIWPVATFAYWNGHTVSGQTNSTWQGQSHGHSQGSWHGHDGGYGHGSWHGFEHGHSYINLSYSFWPDYYYYGLPYYPPDAGTLVSPALYEPVVINGVTYYLNNGTYYVYNGYGYQPVVMPSTMAVQPVTPAVTAAVINQIQSEAPAITAPAGTSQETDSITVNIPNNRGGYTAVTLKKSGNGFIGPQGEYYPEFPKVAQLVIIYGK